MPGEVPKITKALFPTEFELLTKNHQGGPKGPSPSGRGLISISNKLISLTPKVKCHFHKTKSDRPSLILDQIKFGPGLSENWPIFINFHFICICTAVTQKKFDNTSPHIRSSYLFTAAFGRIEPTAIAFIFARHYLRTWVALTLQRWPSYSVAITTYLPTICLNLQRKGKSTHPHLQWEEEKWNHGDSNPRHSACYTSMLPLDHRGLPVVGCSLW